MTDLQTLNVDLGNRSYPIHIGPGLLQKAELLLPHIHGSSVVVVTNTTVAPLYLASLKALLGDIRLDEVILDDGEAYKTLDSVENIISLLLQNRHDRNTTLIALGGGVVGDICGFAAAIYQRGVNFIQVPTTLLSQVDSSVGGKTGVNHPLGKNMIGAFYQPQCVLADTTSLKTLAPRELAAGLAEVIKYGLIYDAAFFVWLENNIEALNAQDPTAIAYAIRRSCEIKAAVVTEDEREAGLRAILNLGHTFGHAIEAAMGYGNWLHGEAVATGMLIATELSYRLEWVDKSVVERCQSLLEAAKLPLKAPASISNNDFIKHMSVDKKVSDGQINLVLLQALGHAVITHDYDREIMFSAIDQHRNPTN